jgi:LmbE family N-acetylglucosaminyl deacetylase
MAYRLTQRIAEELQRLHPGVIVTWGPDGGMGHPDHRMVSNIVTQLQRAHAPGVPERVFYMYLPAEAMRAMNPQRGEPPLLVPDARYVTARVPFRPEDLAQLHPKNL